MFNFNVIGWHYLKIWTANFNEKHMLSALRKGRQLQTVHKDLIIFYGCLFGSSKTTYQLMVAPVDAAYGSGRVAWEMTWSVSVEAWSDLNYVMPASPLCRAYYTQQHNSILISPSPVLGNLPVAQSVCLIAKTLPWFIK